MSSSPKVAAAASQDDEITAISYETEDVGSVISSSKTKYTWRFEIGGQSYLVNLFVSWRSDKYRVVLNGYEQTMQVQKSGKFSYAFKFQGHYFKIVPTRYTDRWDLLIDTVPFYAYTAKGKREQAIRLRQYYEKRMAEKRAANETNDDEYRQMQKQVALLRAQAGVDDDSSSDDQSSDGSSDTDNPQIPPAADLASRIGHRDDYKLQVDAAENAFFNTQLPTFPDELSASSGAAGPSASPPDMLSFDSPDVWGSATAAGVASSAAAMAAFGGQQGDGTGQAGTVQQQQQPQAVYGEGNENPFAAFNALVPPEEDKGLPQGYIPPTLAPQQQQQEYYQRQQQQAAWGMVGGYVAGQMPYQPQPPMSGQQQPQPPVSGQQQPQPPMSGQQQPQPPMSGQQQPQPPMSGQQQPQPPMSGQQQPQPPVSGQQQPQPPMSGQQQPQPPMSGQQQPQPPVSGQQQPQPPVSGQQQPQPPVSGQQQPQPPMSGQQQPQPPMSGQQLPISGSQQYPVVEATPSSASVSSSPIIGQPATAQPVVPDAQSDLHSYATSASYNSDASAPHQQQQHATVTHGGVDAPQVGAAATGYPYYGGAPQSYPVYQMQYPASAASQPSPSPYQQQWPQQGDGYYYYGNNNNNTSPQMPPGNSPVKGGAANEHAASSPVSPEAPAQQQ